MLLGDLDCKDNVNLLPYTVNIIIDICRKKFIVLFMDLSNEQVIERLRQKIEDAGSLAAFARNHKMSRTLIYAALEGDLAPAVLEAIGVSRKYIYCFEEVA